MSDDIDIARLIATVEGAPNDTALAEACRLYTQRCNGDGNADPDTNGEREILNSAIPGRRVVFDVGAHLGHWMTSVLTINPALEIHAFEPDARSYAELMTLRWPATASVKIHPLGLGAEAGEQELWTFGAFSEISSLYRRETLSGLPVEPPTSAGLVKLTTLDAYCREHAIERINFLKIDVEGHDLKVLQGGRRFLATGAADVVQFEYGAANIDSRDLLKDFFAFFADLPYALYKIHPKWVAHHERYDHRLENFLYQNWLAVRLPRTP